MTTTRPRPWLLIGLDTFKGESYWLSDHETEEDCIAAARTRLRVLEVVQPTATSGGQAEDGIQDRVFVMRPDGTSYRFTGDQ